MNGWHGIGRLTRDAEQRSLPDGTPLVSFTLAVDTGSKAKPATMFLDCAAFRSTAEIIAKYAGAKGSQVGVFGSLRQENWEAKDGGGKRSKISCIVDRVTLIGNRSRDAQQSPEESSQVPPESHDSTPEPDNVPF